MYKILFVALVLLAQAANCGGHPWKSKLQTRIVNDLKYMGLELTTATVPNKHNKCHNRFDTAGFQVSTDCVRCAIGTHEDEGKCVSNLVGCSSKTLEATTFNCKSCNFWKWSSKSKVQGNYCYNRWWMWCIIFISAFVGLMLLISMFSYLSFCPSATSKKQKNPSEKVYGGNDREY